MRLSFFVIILAIIAGVIYFLYDNGTEVENIRRDVSQVDFKEQSKSEKAGNKKPSASSEKKSEKKSVEKTVAKSNKEMLEDCREILKELSSKKNKDPQDYEGLLNPAVVKNSDVSPVVRAYVYMASVIIGSNELGNAAKTGASEEELKKMANEWTATCSKCRGTKFVVCPVCRGKCTIEKRTDTVVNKDERGRYTFSKEPAEKVFVKCEKCDGQGKVECSSCSGIRQITYPDVKTSKKNIGKTKKKALELLDYAIASEK